MSQVERLLDYYSLLLGSPTGAFLDFFSTTRESCRTASLGKWRGRLNQSPPSTGRTDPLTYLPENLISKVNSTLFLMTHSKGVGFY